MQPDSIIPDPTNPQDLNRYAYVRNNPYRYIDSNGHEPISAVLIAVGIAAFKIVDYGWTAYDIWQSKRVLSNPNSSRSDKMFASLNIGLAILFETVEIDDILPVGLPLDDVSRQALMKGLKEAYAEGGEEAVERLLREALGDQADDVIERMFKATDYGKLGQLVDDPGLVITQLNDHALNKHGITRNMVEQWSQLEKRVLAQDGGKRFLHITAEGAYVLDAASGRVITAYSKLEYTDEMVNIAKNFGLLP